MQTPVYQDGGVTFDICHGNNNELVLQGGDYTFIVCARDFIGAMEVSLDYWNQDLLDEEAPDAPAIAETLRAVTFDPQNIITDSPTIRLYVPQSCTIRWTTRGPTVFMPLVVFMTEALEWLELHPTLPLIGYATSPLKAKWRKACEGEQVAKAA